MKKLLKKIFCFIGFHKMYKKSGEGFFYTGVCFNCKKLIG